MGSNFSYFNYAMKTKRIYNIYNYEKVTPFSPLSLSSKKV
jgi:lysine/ornithine N-monooxygenase